MRQLEQLYNVNKNSVILSNENENEIEDHSVVTHFHIISVPMCLRGVSRRDCVELIASVTLHAHTHQSTYHLAIYIYIYL